jgi:succinoglycan biosynthesis protein ExoA
MRELMHGHNGSGTRAVACSVLIPVLNEERQIAESLRAMLAQECPGELEFLVVDGGSSDRTREIVAELAAEDPRIRLLHNPHRTAASGLNVGLANARGNWVARMDGHTRYPSRYVALGIERLAQGNTRWVSGPPIPVGRGAVSRAVALALRTPLGRGGSRKWAAEVGATGEAGETGEYQLDSGVFAGVWERATVLEYGGWDEHWHRNQDSEMAGRFLARGERLICLPAMASYYLPRDSLRSLWRQYMQYGEFREMTAVRHPNTMRLSHLAPPALVATVALGVSAPRRPVRTFARGALSAYACVLGLAGLHAARSAEDARDATLVPLVLAVMHLAHGAGAWVGGYRHGAPVAGIARVLRMQALASRLWPEATAVHAPSLEQAAAPPTSLDAFRVPEHPGADVAPRSPRAA